MSIFKTEQRDPRYLLGIVRGLLGKRCKSYLEHYPLNGPRRECKLRDGHRNKHTDGEIKWGYGDNWVEKDLVKEDWDNGS